MSKLYDNRNTIELGQHFTNHLSAMTSENLHSKSDIAAELAYRDSIIEKLNYEIYSLQCSVDDLKSEIAYIEGLIQEDELTQEIDELNNEINSLADLNNVIDNLVSQIDSLADDSNNH